MNLHDPLPRSLLRLVILLVCEEISRRTKMLQMEGVCVYIIYVCIKYEICI